MQTLGAEGRGGRPNEAMTIKLHSRAGIVAFIEYFKYDYLILTCVYQSPRFEASCLLVPYPQARD